MDSPYHSERMNKKELKAWHDLVPSLHAFSNSMTPDLLN